MKKKFTFSKWVIILYFVFCLIWVSCSYILAFTGHENTLQELAGQIVTVGIGAIIGYFCKAFFETREEERLRLEREKFEKEIAKDEDEENME